LREAPAQVNELAALPEIWISAAPAQDNVLADPDCRSAKHDHCVAIAPAQFAVIMTPVPPIIAVIMGLVLRGHGGTDPKRRRGIVIMGSVLLEQQQAHDHEAGAEGTGAGRVHDHGITVAVDTRLP
jgi:hypothetical protein